MKQYKEHTWYKVFYTFVAFNGNTYTTFEYAMGTKQIEEAEQRHKANGTYVKTIEWIV